MHSTHFEPCAVCASEFQKLKDAFTALVGVNQKLKGANDELMGVNQKLLSDARTDTLTGLANRLGFKEVFEMARAAVERKARQKVPKSKRRRNVVDEGVLCIAILDIDFFKKVNDTYGHLIGDAILRKLGEILKSPAVRFRATDLVARWGGEEFIILMPDTKLGGAQEKIEALRKHVETHLFVTVSDVRVSATISCGIAAYRPGSSADEVIGDADGALYRSKAGGRNRTSIAVKM